MSIIRMIGGKDVGAFKFNGEEYPYFHHPKNNTKVNERIVEVPIIRKVIESKREATLEVGNVLGQYLGRRWTTIDLVEKEKGVTNVDVLAWKGGPYDLIVSISTFEHVGLDYGKKIPTRAADAVLHCQGLLMPGGRLVFTIPMGYHPGFDEWLMTTWSGKKSYLKRVSLDNRWEQAEADVVKGAEYGKPYKYGNVILVGEYVRPA